MIKTMEEIGLMVRDGAERASERGSEGVRERGSEGGREGEKHINITNVHINSRHMFKKWTDVDVSKFIWPIYDCQCMSSDKYYNMVTINGTWLLLTPMLIEMIYCENFILTNMIYDIEIKTNKQLIHLTF